MQEEHKFVLLMARTVELLKQVPLNRDECLQALQHLVDHASRRSGTIRLHEGALAIEGYTAPQDVPFVKLFVRQMGLHSIGEIRISQGTPAVDLVYLLKGLASEATQPPLSQVLSEAHVHSVAVVEAKIAEVIRKRRIMDLSAAFERIVEGKPSPAEQRASQLEFVPAQEGAAYGQMVEMAQASSTSLAAAVRRLRGHPDGPELSKGLNAVAVGVVNAVRDDRMPEAVEAIIAVIKQEEEEEREEVRLRYGVALRRILQPEVLKPLLPYLLDEIYANDIAFIMRRAGTKGTELLLEDLVQAPTFAERRAFMLALRQIEQGTDMVVGMLKHPEWFVVRNVADLVGEMKIEEGVPALGECMKHQDPRVRLSAGLALAKIGSPASVKYIGMAIRDAESKVRLEVTKAVDGRGVGALAMPLVNALEKEEDEGIRRAMYHALGRVGSADAVTALDKASKPGGLVIGRRNASDRLAATEGLVFAGGGRAREALQALTKDRDKQVREVARQGLVELSNRGK